MPFTVLTKERDSVNGTVIDFGYIQSINMNYKPTISSTQIPGQPAENNFRMDSGVVRRIDISFIRVCPAVCHDDYAHPSTEWSNGFWLHNVVYLITNRWQMGTDGCKIQYVDGGENDPQSFVDIPLTNAYVSSHSISYTNRSIQAISGDMSFTVGGMYLDDVIEATVIYRANFGEFNDLDDTGTNLVKSYNTTAGIEVEQYPADWVVYLQTKGKQIVSTDVWFCTNTTDSLTTAKANGTAYKYGATEQSQIKKQITFANANIITLYARYSTQ